MSKKIQILCYLLVPVICVTLVAIARRNIAERRRLQTPAVEPGESPQDPTQDPDPAPPPPPPRPRGIEDYREVEVAIPKALTALLAKSSSKNPGTAILVAPKRKLILFRKGDDRVVPIASMTKMMSVLLTMELAGQNGAAGLDDKVQVSRAAEAVEERQVWLKAGHQYPLRDLLRASLVYSANDAMYACAEAVAPQNDVSKFIILMNRRSRELGMNTARFYTVHGLQGRGANQENRATCRDMVVLAMTLRKQELAREWGKLTNATFTHNNGKKVAMQNTNRHLLRGCAGVNGMKTGHTNSAGFCVAATCERDGEPLIAVATGFTRSSDRYLFVSRLMDWGYSILNELDRK